MPNSTKYQVEQSSYVYLKKINGQKVHEAINTNATEFNNMKVYASDPWHSQNIDTNVRLLSIILSKSLRLRRLEICISKQSKMILLVGLLWMELTVGMTVVAVAAVHIAE